MKRLLSILIFAMTLPFCQQETGVNQSQHNDDFGSEINSECFVQLHPGRTSEGRMESVTYQHGACVGKYKALNKSSTQEHVYVAESEEGVKNATQSDLYVSDDKVSVKKNGDLVQIGTLEENGVDISMDLLEGVDFDLLINGDETSMRSWQLTDGSAPRGKEVIIIYLR